MSADPAPLIVLAAVIERDGTFLVSRRLKGTHLEGLWEFPGGKCGPDETHEECLARELMEELGVGSVIGEEILLPSTVPGTTVRLHFRHCRITNDPEPLLGQELQWVERGALNKLPLPDADRDLIRLLTS